MVPAVAAEPGCRTPLRWAAFPADSSLPSPGHCLHSPPLFRVVDDLRPCSPVWLFAEALGVSLQPLFIEGKRPPFPVPPPFASLPA